MIIELAHSIDAQLAPMAKEGGYKLPGRGELPHAALQEAMAYQLRELVSRHIQDKHLGTAYASASETARTASGDCTEHAVLLAAVLRARGARPLDLGCTPTPSTRALVRGTPPAVTAPRSRLWVGRERARVVRPRTRHRPHAPP